MQKYTAIEITAPAVFELVKLMEPMYSDIEYELVHLKFAVLGYPSMGDVTLIKPEMLTSICDHLEPGIKIRLTQLHDD